jgi:hypothetical protein
MSTAFGDFEKEVVIVVETGVVAMFTVLLTAASVPDAVKIRLNAVLTPPATSLSWSSVSSIKLSTFAHS